MPSRLAVVLVSLLMAAPVVIFWIWLVILPAGRELICPEKCRCELDGFDVNCSMSGLNSIPSNLPTHVRRLVLDNMNITFFENDTFASRGLVELVTLLADFCKLRKIELGALNGLTILKELSVNGNEISEIIQGTFEKMSRLVKLQLDNNEIKQLDRNTLYGLVNLKNLSLQGNKLQYLHPDILVGLPNIQFLFLSYNPGLQVPTDRHFINSNSLKHLRISGCNIKSVSVETFANVSALDYLSLVFNKLRSVEMNILTALPELSALYLYFNPLHCDCKLQEVWRWCQDHNMQTAYKQYAPICVTPSEVEGMWWGC